MSYRGSNKTVRRYLQPLRDADAALPAPVTPTVRQGTGWLTRRPALLTNDDCARFDSRLGRSPALADIREFAELTTNRRGDDLSDWMRTVDTGEGPAPRPFVAGLRRYLNAVTAGLTWPYNPGAVEGRVNRIKMLKRQMYGVRSRHAPQTCNFHCLTKQRNIIGKCARSEKFPVSVTDILTRVASPMRIGLL